MIRIVLLSLCIASTVSAADVSRGYLAQQILDAESQIERLTATYAEQIGEVEADLERVRASAQRKVTTAESKVSSAQAAFGDASRDKAGRRPAARGRRIDAVTRNVNTDLATRLGVPEVRGALVAKIKYDSEAYSAGLRAGDVILMFNGLPVVVESDLSALAKRAERGRKIYLEVWRDHAEVIVGLPAVDDPRVKRARARLDRARDELAAAEAMMIEQVSSAEGLLADLRAEQSSQMAAARADLDELRTQLADLNRRFGVKLTNLPKDVASYFQVSSGAYVREVAAGSRADETGLQPADIVLRFADTVVRDARHLTDLIRKTGAEDSVQVEVLRNGQMALMTTPGALDT